ncbi:hypothetical protein BDR04DRAFT_1119651 [Suillus decipiens]|nr:hypothetical protein BDR04DRAFT_1119651 [Suillus decipiens]
MILEQIQRLLQHGKAHLDNGKVSDEASDEGLATVGEAVRYRGCQNRKLIMEFAWYGAESGVPIPPLGRHSQCQERVSGEYPDVRGAGRTDDRGLDFLNLEEVLPSRQDREGLKGARNQHEVWTFEVGGWNTIKVWRMESGRCQSNDKTGSFGSGGGIYCAGITDGNPKNHHKGQSSSSGKGSANQYKAWNMASLKIGVLRMEEVRWSKAFLIVAHEKMSAENPTDQWIISGSASRISEWHMKNTKEVNDKTFQRWSDGQMIGGLDGQRTGGSDDWMIG